VKRTYVHLALEMDAGLAMKYWSFERYQETETRLLLGTDESSFTTGLHTGIRPIVEIPFLGGRLPFHLAAEVSNQWIWSGRPSSMDHEPASTWSIGGEVGIGVRI